MQVKAMRSRWFMRLSFVVVGAVLASGLGWMTPARAATAAGCLIGETAARSGVPGGCGPSLGTPYGSGLEIYSPTGALPPGIRYVPETTGWGSSAMHFAGTYTAAGRYVWNLRYKLGYSSETFSQPYVFTIWDGPPVFASGTHTTTGTVGVNVPAAGGYALPFSQYPNAFDFSGLPPGMLLDASNGVLHGTPTQAGTYTVSVSGSNSFGTASGTIEITIAPGAQTLSFTNPGAKAMSSTPFALNVTASSRLTPTVVSTTTSICSVDGLNLTMLGIGTCTLRASQAGNSSYAAATDVPVSFSISKGNQTPLSITSVTGSYGSPITLTTSGGSGSGAETFVVNSQGATGCSLTSASSTDLQFTAPGTCTVTATKALDSNFNVVSSSSTAIVIGKGTQADLLLTSISGTFGTALPFVTSGGSGVGVVSFVVTSAGTAGCSLATSTSLTSTGVGTCSVRVSKALDTNYNAITSAITTVTFAAPVVAPSAPTLTSVTAGNARVTAAFTAGANGGSTILNYEYSLDGGANWTPRSPASATTSFDITGLTNGTSYSIKLRAVSAVGSGTASNAISSTPVTVATAPTELAGSALDQRITLYWTAPENPLGAPISGYQIQVSTTTRTGSYSNVATGTCASAAPTSIGTSCTITGLTNGSMYFFKVAALNSVGSSLNSIATSGIIPRTIPDAPTLTGLQAGNRSLDVTFTFGGNGGNGISAFEYSIDSGATWIDSHATVSSTSFTISDLTNGTIYNVILLAVNDAGNSLESNALSATPVTISSAPSNVAVAYGYESAHISFINGDDGGSPITEYEYSIDGGITWTSQNQVPLTSGLTISGLAIGVEHSLKLRAITTQGPGVSTGAMAIMIPVPAVLLPALTINVGATSRIEGTGFVPMSDIRIEIHSTPTVLGTVQSDTNGNFITDISIPTEFAVGDHHLVFIYVSTGVEANSLPITIKVREAMTEAAPVASPVASPDTPPDASPDTSLAASPVTEEPSTPPTVAEESSAPPTVISESPTTEVSDSVDTTTAPPGSANAESSDDADSSNYPSRMWLLLVILILLVAYMRYRSQRRKS